MFVPALLAVRPAGTLRAARIQMVGSDYTSRTESEWRETLTPQEFDVLRKAGTEPPWSSPLNELEAPGVLVCAGCETSLFRTSEKFESGSGWPSFWAPAGDGAVEVRTDFKLVVPRAEVVCKSCGGHLGHRFSDGPMPTGQRYCINGVTLRHVPDTAAPQLAAAAAEAFAASTSATRPPLSAVLPDLVLSGLLVIGELLHVAAAGPEAAQTWGPAVLPYLPPGGPVGAALLAVGAAVFGRNAFLLAQSSDSE